MTFEDNFGFGAALVDKDLGLERKDEGLYLDEALGNGEFEPP